MTEFLFFGHKINKQDIKNLFYPDSSFQKLSNVRENHNPLALKNNWDGPGWHRIWDILHSYRHLNYLFNIVIGIVLHTKY